MPTDPAKTAAPRDYAGTIATSRLPIRPIGLLKARIDGAPPRCRPACLRCILTLAAGLAAASTLRAQDSDAGVPPAAQALLQQGKEAGSNHDYELAIQKFEAARRLAPRYPELYYYLGAAHEGAGHPLRAVAWLSAYAAAMPDSPKATQVLLEIGRLKAETQQKLDQIVQKASETASLLPEGQNRNGAFGSLCGYWASRGKLDQALKLNPWPGNDAWLYSAYLDGLLASGTSADDPAIQEALAHCDPPLGRVRLGKYFIHRVQSGDFSALNDRRPNLGAYADGTDALLAAVESELDRGDWKDALAWCDRMPPDPALELESSPAASLWGSAPSPDQIAPTYAWPKHQALLEIALARFQAGDEQTARGLARRILGEPADPDGSGVPLEHGRIDAGQLMDSLESHRPHAQLDWDFPKNFGSYSPFEKLCLFVAGAECILGDDQAVRNMFSEGSPAGGGSLISHFEDPVVIGQIQMWRGDLNAATKTAEAAAETKKAFTGDARTDAWLPVVEYHLHAGDEDKARDALAGMPDDGRAALTKAMDAWDGTPDSLSAAIGRAVTENFVRQDALTFDWSRIGETRRPPSEVDDWLQWIADFEVMTRDHEISGDDISGQLKKISAEDAADIPSGFASLAGQLEDRLQGIGRIESGWTR